MQSRGEAGQQEHLGILRNKLNKNKQNIPERQQARLNTAGGEAMLCLSAGCLSPHLTDGLELPQYKTDSNFLE